MKDLPHGGERSDAPLMDSRRKSWHRAETIAKKGRYHRYFPSQCLIIEVCGLLLLLGTLPSGKEESEGPSSTAIPVILIDNSHE